MKIELNESAGITISISMVVVLLMILITSVKACNNQNNREITERCKALIESKADILTINETCSKVSQ